MAPKYSFWPGSNNFICGGRIILGPSGSLPTLLFSCALLFAPSILFIIFVANKWSIALTIITCAILAFDVAALIAVVSTEPGILPRAPEPGDRTMPPVVAVLVDGRPTNLRYCATCHIYRHPKSAHCSVCDNCIDNFDHHCSWVGTCVGRRNYRYFLLFVTGTFALCIFVVVVSFLFLWRDVSERWHDGDKRGWIDIALEQPVAAIVFLIALVFIFSLGALLIFHCYLLAIGKTTREQLKGLGRKEGNWVSNIAQHFCTEQTPSRLEKIRLRDEVPLEEGSDWFEVYSDIPDESAVFSAITIADQLDKRNQGLPAPLLASSSWHVNAAMQPPMSPKGATCCPSWSSSKSQKDGKEMEKTPMLQSQARDYGAVQPLQDAATDEEEEL